MKRIIYVIIILLAVASIINSIHSIYELFHKRDLLISAEKELDRQKQANIQLKNQLQKVSNDTFVEEEARNKLFFVKPGEHTVFIAKNLVITPTPEPKKRVEKSNWQQWIAAFTN